MPQNYGNAIVLTALENAAFNAAVVLAGLLPLPR
jgi:hypothetical protein